MALLNKRTSSQSASRRCARDFARRPGSPTWRDYCPKVATLDALNTMPWMSRSEW
jgi:hypothetical protein